MKKKKSWKKTVKKLPIATRKAVQVKVNWKIQKLYPNERVVGLRSLPNVFTLTATNTKTFSILFFLILQKFLGEDCSTSENAGPSISDDNDDKDGDKDSKKKKNRCAVCRKKVGLTGK